MGRDREGQGEGREQGGDKGGTGKWLARVHTATHLDQPWPHHLIRLIEPARTFKSCRRCASRLVAQNLSSPGL